MGFSGVLRGAGARWSGRRVLVVGLKKRRLTRMRKDAMERGLCEIGEMFVENVAQITGILFLWSSIEFDAAQRASSSSSPAQVRAGLASRPTPQKGPTGRQFRFAIERRSTRGREVRSRNRWESLSFYGVLWRMRRCARAVEQWNSRENVWPADGTENFSKN